MDDALKSILEAMEAAFRLVDKLEDQLLAARDANSRLTAEIVRLEMESTRLLAQVDQLEARIMRLEP